MQLMKNIQSDDVVIRITRDPNGLEWQLVCIVFRYPACAVYRYFRWVLLELGKVEAHCYTALPMPCPPRETGLPYILWYHYQQRRGNGRLCPRVDDLPELCGGGETIIFPRRMGTYSITAAYACSLA